MEAVAIEGNNVRVVNFRTSGAVHQGAEHSEVIVAFGDQNRVKVSPGSDDGGIEFKGNTYKVAPKKRPARNNKSVIRAVMESIESARKEQVK